MLLALRTIFPDIIVNEPSTHGSMLKEWQLILNGVLTCMDSFIDRNDMLGAQPVNGLSIHLHHA